MIKYLEEKGIQIDFIAGSSIGALIGGAYASGMSIKEIEEIALESDITSTAKLFSPSLGKSGFVSGTKVEEFLISKFGNKYIEDFKIPFIAIASDIITGEEIHLNKGKLSEAIRASISIPIVFQPAILNNIVLVDGGLVNPLPINVTRKMGADYIIAVNILSSQEKEESKDNEPLNNKMELENSSEIIPILKRKFEDFIIDNKWIKNFIKQKEKQDFPGMRRIFNQSVQIIEEKLIKLSVELYKPNIVIEPKVKDISIFDFHKADNKINEGYKAAKEILHNQEKKIN